jgi:hypothetical protein
MTNAMPPAAEKEAGASKQPAKSRKKPPTKKTKVAKPPAKKAKVAKPRVVKKKATESSSQGQSGGDGACEMESEPSPASSL